MLDSTETVGLYGLDAGESTPASLNVLSYDLQKGATLFVSDSESDIYRDAH
ncbi:MAG: hypothetical protein QM607_08520 [Microbacterium sp.]